jgi:iron-regulated transporter 1
MFCTICWLGGRPLLSVFLYNRWIYIAISAIVLQKLLIALSAILFLFKLDFGFGELPKNVPLDWIFFTLVLNGAILQVANLVSRIAIERDWSSCIAASGQGELSLSQLNARLRSIDLCCDLLAPVVVTGVASIWTIQVAMLFVIFVSSCSIPIELTLINKVYAGFPSLQQKDQQTTRRDALSPQLVIKLLNHPVIITCFSISILYMTILTLNTVSVTYLLSKNADLFIISLFRSLSVLTGLSSTYTFSKISFRLGLLKTGLVSIWSQFACVSVVVGSFYCLENENGNFLSVLMFLLGICFSRWGLWTFDLVQQQLLQENIPNNELGVVSGFEIALQNAFQMIAYSFTIFWNNPKDFWIPSHISGGSVLAAALSFTYYVSVYGNVAAPDEERLIPEVDPDSIDMFDSE